MNTLDDIADAIRHKHAEQCHATPLEWKWLTEPERGKWRELALIAALHFSKADVT